MVDEAFVRVMVNASELGTAEVRAKVAWKGWKQLRLALGPKPRRGSDVRYAVAATEWADSSGGMTNAFLDHLHEIEEENRELRAGAADEEGADAEPGVMDRARSLFSSFTDIGEAEANQPTVTLGPPLELPAEEPPEGYLNMAYRKWSEAVGNARDYVYDNTIGPVLQNVEDKANKAKNAAIAVAAVLGALWIFSRSAG